MQKLTEAELKQARSNFAEAKASLACVGMVLTVAEEELFQQFDRERLSHEECRRRAIEFCRHMRRQNVTAAE